MSLLSSSLKIAARVVRLFTKDLRQPSVGERFDIGIEIRGHRRLANGKIDHGQLVEKALVIVPDSFMVGLGEWLGDSEQNPVQLIMRKVFDYEAGDRLVLVRLDLEGQDGARLPLGGPISRYLYRRAVGLPEPSTPDEDDGDDE